MQDPLPPPPEPFDLSYLPGLRSFPLIRRRRLGRRLVISSSAALAGFWLAVTFLVQDGSVPPLLPLVGSSGPSPWLLCLLAGLAVGAVTFHTTRPPADPGVVRLLTDAVLLPLGGERHAEFPLLRLWLATACGEGRRRRFVIAAAGYGFVQIRADQFAPGTSGTSGDGPAELAAAVHRRLAALPGGEAVLRDVARRGSWAEAFFAPRGPVTWIAVLLLTAVFGLQLAAGSLLDPIVLLSLGANSGPLVLQGEVFRLVTANLLHAVPLHLLLNLVGLVVAGRIFEHFLGISRYLVLLLVSSIAGAAASALAGHFLSVGASTGIAGLVGAYAWLRWRHGETFPLPPSRFFWLLLVAAFLLPSLVFPNIDHAGHAGGFVAGGALMALMMPGRARRSWGYRLAAAALSLLFVGATAVTVSRTFGERTDRLPLAALLLENPDVPDLLLNNLAWEIAVDPGAPPALLEKALEAAGRAVDAEPGAHEAQDTLATVLYRLGRYDEAIDLESPLAARGDNPFYRGQLARFRWARLRQEGVALHRGVPPGPALDLEERRLLASNPLAQPVRLAAALHRGEQLLGEITIELPADTDPTGLDLDELGLEKASLEKITWHPFEVTLTAVEALDRTPPRPRSQVYRLPPEVSSLP